MNSNEIVALEPTDHQHTSSCWWDHHEGGWTCAGDNAGNNAEDGADDRTDKGVDGGVARQDTPPTEPVDVRDMVVVHTALLREFRLAPAAVERVTDGDAKQVRRVEDHLKLLCQLMHHHHTGEDELLWPVLSPRITPAELALLAVAEAQHAGIEQALAAVQAARAAWTDHNDAVTRAALADTLRTLYRLLTEHLEAEERNLLPLAAIHLSPAEWHAIGEAGAAGVPKSAMLLVFGMFAYEGDPVVLADMLHEAPPPVRVLVPRIAPRLYARHARRIHGSPRP